MYRDTTQTVIADMDIGRDVIADCSRRQDEYHILIYLFMAQSYTDT